MLLVRILGQADAYDYDATAWTSWPALPGIRCEEFVDYYPVGVEGGTWSDELGKEAIQHCSELENCGGVMRYVGDSDTGKYFWAGRPQFCRTDGSHSTKKNSDWVAAYKPGYLFRGCADKYPDCKIGADPWFIDENQNFVRVSAQEAAFNSAPSEGGVVDVFGGNRNGNGIASVDSRGRGAAAGATGTRTNMTQLSAAPAEDSDYDYIFTASLKMPFFARKGKYIHLDLREFFGAGLGASEPKSGFMS
eukprot:g17049.t1